MSIFQGVIYTLDPVLDSTLRTHLTNLLESNGATQGQEINVYISKKNTLNQPDIYSITPLWVEVAVNNGFVHNPKYYSPSKSNSFLSGIVLMILDVPQPEIELISKEIKKYSGQIRNDLTEDISHLICIDPRGVQYTHCIEHRIPVVLPHWLDDCLRLKERLDTRPYQFPKPIVHTSTTLLYPYPKLDNMITSTERSLFKHTIYFGNDIQFKEDFKSRLIQSIKRAGGTISTEYNQIVTLVILKYRTEATRAFEDGKQIASLWWLTNTLARGCFISPLSTVLDYPVPPGGIPEMEHISITITGYKDLDRDFLRRLVIHSGACLNPLMDSGATHLVCGNVQSDKYKEARRRELVVVNHIWLEECFALWKILKINRRYTHLTSHSVARTHLLPDKVELWMNPDTRPAYQQDKHTYRVIGLDQKGSVDIVKPRKAAVQAIRVLNSIVMPDLNTYEKENRLPKKRFKN